MMDQPKSRPRQEDGRVHGVVGAICRNDGSWLMIRRSHNVSLAPLKVCFPGGVVEVGESQAQALIREFHEELAIKIAPMEPVWRFDWPDQPLTIYGWTARWLAGDIQPETREVAEVLWLTSAQATNHPEGIATNASFIRALQETSAPSVAPSVLDDKRFRAAP